MADVETLRLRFTVDDSALSRAGRNAERVTGGITKTLGRAAIGVGTALAAVGIGRLVTDTVKAAATFDTTLRQMAVVAGVPAAGLKNLSKLALKMGADTSFSAQQAAEAMLALAKGGMKPAEIEAGGLKASLTLAAAGGLELGNAAEFIVRGLGQFKLKAKQSAKVAAALAGGANASTASVQSLGEGLAQVGLVADSFGLDLNDTVGILSAFDTVALKGSDAGTSLKTMLISLANPTAKAKAEMADLGLKFTDAHGRFVDIATIADRLRNGLKGLTDEQRNAALATIFGTDAFRAAKALYDSGGESVRKYTAATKDLGAAEELAKAKTEGAAGAFEKLKGAFETIQIQIGTKFLPALAGAAGTIADKLPAAFEAVESALGKVDFAGFFDKLSNVGGKVLDKAKGWAGDIVEGVKQGFESGDFSSLGTALGNALGEIIGNGSTLIGGAFKNVQWLDLGKTAGKNAGPFVIGFFNEFTTSILMEAKNHPLDFALFLASIIPIGRGAGLLAKIFGKLPIVGTLLKTLQSSGKLLEKPVFAIIGGIARSFASGFAKHFPGVGKALKGRLDDLVTAVYVRVDDMFKAGVRFLGGLVSGIGSALGRITAAIARVIKRILGPFAGAGGWLVDRGAAIIGGLARGIAGAIGRVVAPLAGIAGRVRGALAGAGSWLYNAGRSIIQGLINGIGSLAGSVAEKARSIAQSAKDAVIGIIKPGSPSKVFTEIGRTIPQGLAKGMEEGLQLVSVAAVRMSRAALPTKLQKDAATLLKALKAGKRVFEDFSFRGDPKSFNNDALLRAFTKKHPGFDFTGSQRSRSVVERFLAGLIGTTPRATPAPRKVVAKQASSPAAAFAASGTISTPSVGAIHIHQNPGEDYRTLIARLRFEAIRSIA